MAKRKAKKRKLKKTLFIVCEGRNTEPIYFAGLIEDIRQQTKDYSYEVVIHDTPKNDPVGLINEAKSLVEDAPKDEVWAVFDKDGYTKHTEAFDMARKQKPRVNIAFSSISFEQWVLLHFERNRQPYERSKEIIAHLREEKLFENYSKKKKLNLYAKLKRKTPYALENAAWLRYKQASEISKHHEKIYELNPYTNVDKLVRKLLIHTQFLKFGTFSDLFSFRNFSFKLLKFEQEKDNIKLEFELKNKTKNTIDWRNKIVLQKGKKHFSANNYSNLLLFGQQEKKIKLEFPSFKVKNEIKINILAENLLLIIEL